MAKKPKGALPSKQDILRYIAEHPGNVGKREIAKAFKIGPADRVALKAVLRELKREGEITPAQGQHVVPKGVLPEFCLTDIVRLTRDGDLVGRPVEWTGEGDPPQIDLSVGATRGRELGAVGVGDRVLAKIRQAGSHRYQGRVVRVLESREQPVLGLYYMTEDGNGDGGLQPTDRKIRHEYVIAPEHAGNAKPGQLVVAEPLPGRRFGQRPARVIEIVGNADDPRALSLISIHTHGIPTAFSAEAEAEAAKAKPVTTKDREDLRKIPLITIDPEDARDHDDAVFAEPDDDPNNPGGWHAIVAIADVAHYVRPNSALDREARQRGNSTYFPDRVVPMLPETLSADLCSLMDGKDRASLAVHLWFDADGNKRRHRFCRAIIRVAAGLHYAQVQQAIDGHPDDASDRWLDGVLRPLYACHAALNKARAARQPLSISSDERRVMIGSDGGIAAIRPREHLLAHQVIEDYMIAANVAAAEELEKHRQPCMYRVHEPPSPDKVDSTRRFLETLDLRLAKGQVLRPQHFNRVLEMVKGGEHERLVNTVVLRTQMQAYYSAKNQGHFGLNLSRYAHFTSPIRRYSDVLVHRGLVSALGLGNDGLTEPDRAAFDNIAEHISFTERRSMLAERDAMDRFVAAFMADHVGADFSAHITSVNRFGLFVELDETGADGFVPMSSLGDDFYQHDEARHALVGRRTKKRYRLGDAVAVRLMEATPVTGGLRFELLNRDGVPLGGHRPAARGGKPNFKKPKQGRPSQIKNTRNPKRR